MIGQGDGSGAFCMLGADPLLPTMYISFKATKLSVCTDLFGICDTVDIAFWGVKGWLFDDKTAGEMRPLASWWCRRGTATEVGGLIV